MFSLFRILPFGMKPLLLVAASAFVVFVATAQPTWARDPLRDIAEYGLERFGVGVVPMGLWAVGFLYLFYTRFFTLIRYWQLIVGSAFLVAGVQALLTYFEANLPIIGYEIMGGELGLTIRGSSDTLGYAMVGVLLAVGIWFTVPALANRFLRGVRKGATKTVGGTAAGSARVYRTVPVHKVIGKLIGGAARGGGAMVARGGGIAAKQVREKRAAREASALGRELSDFLGQQAAASPESPPSPGESDDPPERVEPPQARSSPPPAPESAPTKTATRLNEQLAVATPVDAATEPSASKPATKRAEPAPPSWKLPSLGDLIPGSPAGAITEEHHATASLIEETLGQHGVEVSVAEIKPGPSVTMFGLVPGWNRRYRPRPRRSVEGEEGISAADALGEARNRVKVDSILAREKDLALALAAPSLRIEAPVPGESVVGVEVPNKKSTTVTIRSVMESQEYQNKVEEDGLPVALGLASAGEAVVIDLLKMPHLLIAGATGSGKSVCMNSIISSLITSQSPTKVRLLLVDPKRVELTPYNGVPHLVTPVIVEPDRVVRLLRGAIEEMGRRYKLLEEAGVRNIQSYNRSPKATELMPYFVVCIDELADLMMTSSFDVEQTICRLAQLGRATGIHMVIATQRPSVDVVTGLIKANFPSRIAFAVASQVDSRTIIDGVGAERLLGRGDMLFLSPDAAKPKRVQGVLITDEETERLANHWRAHPPLDLPKIELEDLAREAELVAAVQNAAIEVDDSADSLYDRAVQLAGANRHLSTSLLQRRLRIGYPRAARLMDQLEDDGIVAASAEPGKPREVLYRPD